MHALAPSRPTQLGLLAAASIAALCTLAVLARSARAPVRPAGAVVHIVLLAYTPDTSAAQKAAIAGAFVRLRDACVRDGRPYILAIDGGPDRSPDTAHEVRLLGHLFRAQR